MSVTILTYPDKRLRQASQAVEVFGEPLADTVARLQQALGEGPGAVGIAAPQLGIFRRMVIIDCRNSMRPCRNHGRLLMINPEITACTGERVGREGCLSVPDWVGMVPRAVEVEVRYQDIDGNWHVLQSRGFEARVMQHEIDHLDGILFIDRVVSRRDLLRRLSRET